MFYTIKREFVDFDEFDSYKFKKTLCSFDNNDLKDSLFDSIIYGLLFKLSKDSYIEKDRIEEVLGKEFYSNFLKKKKNIRAGSIPW